MGEPAKCPYCDRSVASEPFSCEHVVPLAIGGGRDFSISAHRKCNGDLGSKVDAPLYNSFLVTALCAQYGIASRSGVPDVEFRGEILQSGKDISAIWTGEAFEYHAKPEVEKVGNSQYVVNVMADDEERFVSQFKESFGKKGLEAHIASRRVDRVERPTIMVPVTVDLFVLTRALAKVIYAAAWYKWGEGFLHNNPIARKLRDVLWADSADEIRTALRGTGLQGLMGLERVLPATQCHEHLLALLVFPKQVTGIAMLFGSQFFTAMIKIAPSSWRRPLNGEFEGTAYVTDARTRKTETIDLMDHFLRLAQGCE